MKTAIEWMARHPVAANLLLVFMFIAGVINVYTIPVEVFPETKLELSLIHI